MLWYDNPCVGFANLCNCRVQFVPLAMACAMCCLKCSSWSIIRPSSFCVGEGVIMLKVRSSGDLIIGCSFPFWVGSFSFFLEKSISCNLSISKKELCLLNH